MPWVCSIIVGLKTYLCAWMHSIYAAESGDALKTMIRKICNGVTTVLVVLIVLLAVALWGVQLFGVQVLVVQSGSMEPEYPTGSVVYVTPAAPEELALRDVVTFRVGSHSLGTHRIIEILEEDGKTLYRTKGDANDQADGLISADDIVGKVRFSIPLLGYLVAYIQKPPGMYVAIAVAACILLLMVLPDLLFDEKKSAKQEDT